MYPMVQFHENSYETLGRIKYCAEHIINGKPIGVVPVEMIWNPATDDQLWYYIPQFPGYEISNYLNVRSLKFFNKYPFGTLVNYTVDKDTGERMFIMSDFDNARRKVPEHDILNSAFYQNQSIDSYGYPVKTFESRKQSRNFRMWLNQDPIVTANKSGLIETSVPINKEEETWMGRFTITDDPEIILDE